MFHRKSNSTHAVQQENRRSQNGTKLTRWNFSNKHENTGSTLLRLLFIYLLFQIQNIDFVVVSPFFIYLLIFIYVFMDGFTSHVWASVASVDLSYMKYYTMAVKLMSRLTLLIDSSSQLCMKHYQSVCCWSVECCGWMKQLLLKLNAYQLCLHLWAHRYLHERVLCAGSKVLPSKSRIRDVPLNNHTDWNSLFWINHLTGSTYFHTSGCFLWH